MLNRLSCSHDRPCSLVASLLEHRKDSSLITLVEKFASLTEHDTELDCPQVHFFTLCLKYELCIFCIEAKGYRIDRSGKL